MKQPQQDLDSELEIGDVEQYRSDKFFTFNHESLVMKVMSNMIDAGSHEMRTGWFNEKRDKGGNITRVYIEDTRLKFIECVKTASMFMACDFDSKAIRRIKMYRKKIKKLKVSLLKDQWNWWKSLSWTERKQMTQQSKGANKDMFNVNLPFWEDFIYEQIDLYRGICKELNKLTKRLNYYQEAEYTETT